MPGKLRDNAVFARFIRELESVIESHPIQCEQVPVITGEVIDRFCVALGPGPRYQIYKEFGHDYDELNHRYVHARQADADHFWYF